MSTDTDATNTPPAKETDPVKLAATLRPELKRACIPEDDSLPWGDLDGLEALADRFWRNPPEMVLMIVYDWLGLAERNPAMFDRVFGAGPGTAGEGAR
jgi:hypothetical protein